MRWKLVVENAGVIHAIINPRQVRALAVSEGCSDSFQDLASWLPSWRIVSTGQRVHQSILGAGRALSSQSRFEGWIALNEKNRWHQLTSYVLDHFKTIISDSLRPTIIATQHGIPQSSHNFFGILKLYNPETCTFFTPVEELGMPLEEMHFVMGLPPGEFPYKEYIPWEEELNNLKQREAELYETY